MFGPVRRRFLQGENILAADYIAAWQKLEQLRASYAAAASEFDAVLLPSCPIEPPKASDLQDDEDLFTSKNLMALQNTRIGNLMGLAALTVPTGVPSCGIMLQGPNEEHLLSLGAAIEKLLN